MSYAILDINDKVVDIVANRPNDTVRWVKTKPGDGAAIGRVYNGWTFDAPRWTSYEFLNRFTPVERKLIWARSKTDEDIADFLMLSQAAQEVVSDDPATIAGMGLLVSKNILTAARKDAILNGA
jgi:hypothetical protein